jgi:hypothetical protein
LEPHEQFFSYLAAVAITGDRDANLDLCLAVMASRCKGSTCNTYCDTKPRFILMRGSSTHVPQWDSYLQCKDHQIFAPPLYPLRHVGDLIKTNDSRRM